MAGPEQHKEDLTPLSAITPIDGRYRATVQELAPFASEAALIRTRVEVEATYLAALTETGIVRPISDTEADFLINLGGNMTDAQIDRVKQIEGETRHDVKAMERVFRETLAGTSMEDLTEWVHFGLTSEDVNNLSYRLMLSRATSNVMVPTLDKVVDALVDKAQRYKEIPMLARTHGQAAIPTTLGKEMANVAFRLNRQVRKAEGVKLTGKFDGAVGNLNAHTLAAPEVDWIKFSRDFVKSLGLEPNPFTTQINPYEDMVELFQAYQRINGIFLDIDQDMWRYISDGWFAQEVKKGEVGSSTMPQKVNPIDFENSEGNVQLANSLFEGMGRKLAVSRLQRDLSDSTTIRNVGSALAYGLLAYKNTLVGLGKIHPNEAAISEALNKNWAILGEGVQTVLRRAGAQDPYSMVAELTRGQRIGPEEWKDWVQNLSIEEDTKARLRELTPEQYIGQAAKLTEMAIEEIQKSRGK